MGASTQVFDPLTGRFNTTALAQGWNRNDPDSIPEEGQWYVKKVGELHEAHFIDNRGNITQLTSAGYLNISELAPPLVLEGALASTDMIRLDVTGDTQNRFVQNADGSMEWGSGSAVADLTLSRSGVGILSIAGRLSMSDGTAAAPAFVCAGSQNTGFFYGGTFSLFSFSYQGNIRIAFGSGMTLGSTSSLNWSSTATITASSDLAIERVSAGIGKVTNSASACEWRVHGDATKYASMYHNGTNAGLYTASGHVQFSGGGINSWSVLSTGMLQPQVANTYDLGDSTNTVRSGYFGTSVSVGTTPATAGHIRLPNNTNIAFRNAANSADVNVVNLDASNHTNINSANATIIRRNGTSIWNFDSADVLYPQTDNGSDIGLVANRPRSIFVGTSVSIGTNPSTAGAIRLANDTHIQFRNAANSADLRALSVDGSNFIVLDDSATSAGVLCKTDLNMADGKNLIVNTTTGTKIGTATSQKLGFYNATPIVQGASVADATDAASAITQLNALISRIEATGLIATV